ncbi:MAG TPA: winged helix-turn-helix domain-containing protein [Thermoanaerobaculia bacterium]
MSRQQRFVYEFGSFRFDPQEGSLRDSERSISLPPRASELLEVLVENATNIVSKEALLDRVWRAHGLFVEEGNVAYTVHLLRGALGEGSGGRKYIENVPRRGYRFAVPVTLVPGEPSGISAFVSPAPAVMPGKRSKRQFTAAAIALAALLSLGLMLRSISVPSPPRILRVTQLTDDRQPKGHLIVAGDSNLFFYDGFPDGFVLSSIPLRGGERSSVKIPSDLEAIDLSPTRSELLALRPDKRQADYELYRWSLSERMPRRVGNLMASSAAWSPDGQRIAYIRAHSVYIADADGTEARRVVTVPGRPETIRWSPDARLLRFNLAMGPDDTDKDAGWLQSIWEIGTDGNDLRRLLHGWDEGLREAAGRWTPDGRYFLFEAVRGRRGELWALREKRGPFRGGREKPVMLSLGTLNLGDFTLSRDGKKLYAIGGRTQYELARYDSRLREFVPYLGGISASWIAFSRDRRWVAYITYPEGVLWRARADGSQPVQLTRGPLRVNGLSWSPDSRWIAFRGQWPGKAPKVYLIPADGGAARPLVRAGLDPVEMDEGIPSFSADGGRVVFGEVPAQYGHGSGNEVIHIYDIAKQQLSTLPGSEGLWTPRWSPSGRYMCAMTIEGQRLALFDFATGRWQRFEIGDIENPTWSRTEQWIQFDSVGEDRALIRVRIADGTVERLASMNELEPARGWNGLALDESPLVVRNMGGSDIYAVDIEFP